MNCNIKIESPAQIKVLINDNMNPSDPFIPHKVYFVFQYTHVIWYRWLYEILAYLMMERLIWKSYWPGSYSWKQIDTDVANLQHENPSIADKVLFLFQYTHIQMIIWFVSISGDRKTHMLIFLLKNWFLHMVSPVNHVEWCFYLTSFVPYLWNNISMLKMFSFSKWWNHFLQDFHYCCRLPHSTILISFFSTQT